VARDILPRNADRLGKTGASAPALRLLGTYQSEESFTLERRRPYKGPGMLYSIMLTMIQKNQIIFFVVPP
jgi:hypothetical protein